MVCWVAGVNWVVLENSNTLSTPQMAKFLHALSSVMEGARSNNRLPQPYYGRVPRFFTRGNIVESSE
jgi:hypothetical protein